MTTSGSTTTLTKYESVKGVCSVVIVGSGPTEAISYVATDGLGSTSEALDGNGNVTAQQLFGPYGGVRYSSGTMPTAKGYTGQYADAATGLDYYNARYYDPAIGQFAQADTDAKGGLNRYGYVAGNPETATDPTGHRRECQSDDSCDSGGNGGCTSNCDSGGGGGCRTDASCGCYVRCRREPETCKLEPISCVLTTTVMAPKYACPDLVCGTGGPQYAGIFGSLGYNFTDLVGYGQQGVQQMITLLKQGLANVQGKESDILVLLGAVGVGAGGMAAGAPGIFVGGVAAAEIGKKYVDLVESNIQDMINQLSKLHLSNDQQIDVNEIAPPPYLSLALSVYGTMYGHLSYTVSTIPLGPTPDFAGYTYDPNPQ